MSYLNAGTIVEHKKHGLGRTYNAKGVIEGKVPVYFATVIKDDIPVEYSKDAILCNPANLQVIGFID